MSKKSKSEAKKRRAANKRAMKASNQKRWQEYAGTESNRKKRGNTRRNSFGLLKHTHSNGECGNIGCCKCSIVGRVAHVKLLLKTSAPKYAVKAADRLGVVLV